MASFISAFDEAPKTPTRSLNQSKSKSVVVASSPENTPPSSPLRKQSSRRASSARAPLTDLSTQSNSEESRKTSSSINAQNGISFMASLNQEKPPAMQIASTASTAIEEVDFDTLSSASSWRFEQMEQEVASLRDEIRSLRNSAPSEAAIEESEPILQQTDETEKWSQLEETIASLHSKIQLLEVQKQEAVVHASLEIAEKTEESEVEFMRHISIRRMESLVSAFLPFLSDEKTKRIARWMTESIGFSARNTMRRVWSLLLLVDLACIFIQTRMPHIWKKLNIQQVPRGWYKRLSTMRYCLEMVLLIQFGIAAHQFATHQRTLTVVKSSASAVYDSVQTFITKYLPTGIIIACTASFATWVYRNRLAHPMLS